MTQEEIRRLFDQTGAYQKGHFLLANGRHTDTYLECAHLTQQAAVAEALCRELAGRCRGAEAQLVVGPALGGMIFGYEVSRALGLRFIYAERKDGVMTFRRGFTISPGTRVLIVEDRVTTGQSVREIMEIVRALGGIVTAVAALVNRTGGRVDLGVPFHTLLAVERPAWESGQCPLCQAGQPLEKPRGRG